MRFMRHIWGNKRCADDEAVPVMAGDGNENGDVQKKQNRKKKWKKAIKKFFLGLLVLVVLLAAVAGAVYLRYRHRWLPVSEYPTDNNLFKCSHCGKEKLVDADDILGIWNLHEIDFFGVHISASDYDAPLSVMFEADGTGYLWDGEEKTPGQWWFAGRSRNKLQYIVVVDGIPMYAWSGAEPGDPFYQSVVFDFNLLKPLYVVNTWNQEEWWYPEWRAFENLNVQLKKMESVPNGEQTDNESQEWLYTEGLTFFYAGLHNEAFEIFTQLGNYRDSAARIKDCENEFAFHQALAIAEEGDFRRAGELLEKVRDYVYVDGSHINMSGNAYEVDLCDYRYENILAAMNSSHYSRILEHTGVDFMGEKIDEAYAGEEHIYISIVGSDAIDAETPLKMGDDSVISIPMTYGELSEAGWLPVRMEAEEMVEPGYSGGVYFENNAGDQIQFGVMNPFSEPVELYKTIAVKVLVYDNEAKSFLFNGIGNGSTAREIIEVFGFPINVDYYDWGLFSLNYGDVEFELDPNTGLLQEVECAVSYDVAEEIAASEQYNKFVADYEAVRFYEERAYDAALKLFEEGNYEEALSAFAELAGYEDCEEKAQECARIIDYAEAEELCAAGKYEEALVIFEELGGYKDSRERVRECEKIIAYAEAELLYTAGNYEEAFAAFTELGNYADSAEKAESCNAILSERQYNDAVALMEKALYAEAAKIFSELRGFKGSEANWKICATKAMLDDPLYQKLVKLLGVAPSADEIDYGSVGTFAYGDDRTEIYISLKNSQAPESEYTFEMDGGLQLRIPATYGELYEAGWRVAETDYSRDSAMIGAKPDDLYPADQLRFCDMIGTNGATIFVTLDNEQNEPVELGSVPVIGIYSEMQGVSVNGITAGATASEIIKAFGWPYSIRTMHRDTFTDITLYYNDSKTAEKIMTIYLDGKTGKLTSFSYRIWPE